MTVSLSLRSVVSGVLLSGLLVACASDSGLSRVQTGLLSGDNAGISRISVCKSTDTEVGSSSQCLQDDAACYQLSNGRWCTGERGNICPAGSVALPGGQSCPARKRCLRIGESLECMVE